MILDEISADLKKDPATSNLLKLSIDTIIEVMRENYQMMDQMRAKMAGTVSIDEFQTEMASKVGIDQLSVVAAKIFQEKAAELKTAVSTNVKKRIAAKSKEIDAQLKKSMERQGKRLDEALPKALEGLMKNFKSGLKKPVKKAPTLKGFKMVQEALDSELKKSPIFEAIGDFTNSRFKEMEVKVEKMGGVFDICDNKDELIRRDYDQLLTRIHELEMFNEYLIEKTGLNFEDNKSSVAVNLFSKVESLEKHLQSMSDVKASPELPTNQKLEERIRLLVAQSTPQDHIREGLKELSRQLAEVQEGRERTRSILEERVTAIEQSVEKRLKSFTVDRFKTLETLRKEFIELNESGLAKFGQSMDRKLKSVVEEVAGISRKVENLALDQEEICRESSNLLTEICKKERYADESFLLINERLKVLEAGQEEDKTQDTEYVTEERMNHYYADLNRKLEEKVEPGEVQIAMDSLQKKLNHFLIANSKELSEKFEKLSDEIQEAAAQKKMEVRESSKVTKSKNGSEQELADTQLAAITSQLEYLQEVVDTKLSAEEFESFLDKNRRYIQENEDNIDTKLGKQF